MGDVSQRDETVPDKSSTSDDNHFDFFVNLLCNNKVGPGNEGKGKAVPLQGRSGPEGSWKLRFPDFMTTAQDGGKVVSLKHRPPLPPGIAPGTHFC